MHGILLSHWIAETLNEISQVKWQSKPNSGYTIVLFHWISETLNVPLF